MNTQLRIAFVLAFSVIGGAALAEDGGAVGTPTSEASQPIATAAHLGEAPQVEANEVPLHEAPRQEANGVEAPQVKAPQVEAHGVSLHEVASPTSF
jgi:hypothetical protein